MRNSGKIALTVFFLAVSAYYLWPSVGAYILRDDSGDQSLADIRQVHEDALNLGLDLLGGMHVTLEVQVDALLNALAVNRDETFQAVMRTARQRVLDEDIPFIDAFVDAFEARDPNARLSRYFREPDAGITRQSSNGEVAAFLRTEANEAVDRAIQIIRDRVNRFGVTEPLIQMQGTRRIVVELPGIDDPQRVRDLLEGTARLEFHLMADPEQLTASLQSIIQYFETADIDSLEGVETTGDTTTTDTTAATPATAATEDTTFDVAEILNDAPAVEGDTSTGNPLLDVMQPIGQGVRFAAVSASDSAEANELLSLPAVQERLPPNIELLYTANPEGGLADGTEIFYLLGVREEVELTGEVIVEARVGFDQMNRAEVSMDMNDEGARIWARLTGANVNDPVAIVLDDVVYSYPNVINRIVGGSSSITGLASRAEAQDIVNILKSGALPAPVEIINERVVGPSLGQASIRAGLYSIISGLILVVLFMAIWYEFAGMVADFALLINVIFILGVLAAFNATLTLPGIAGIILTIGMAIDANVLIYERVREERGKGRLMKAAIDEGYDKALSAIIDGNVTTFFIGVILFSFGVGPIRGFAVTLMIGILATLFSSIVCTRIIFDYQVIERGKSPRFG